MWGQSGVRGMPFYPLPPGVSQASIINVKHRPYYAVGNGIANDTAPIQAAINAAQAIPNVTGAGMVILPPGNYYIPGGLSNPGSVRMFGSGVNATFLNAGNSDVVAYNFTSASSFSSLEALTVYGKGTINDNVFNATQNAVVMNGVSNILRDVKIWGGFYALDIPGTDCVIDNVYPSLSYGAANVHTIGANWFLRDKIDHSPTGIAVTTALPYPAWASGTPYLRGAVVTTGGFAIQCSVAGTSGGGPPTLRNYGLNIVDNTVTWLLLSPATYNAIWFDTNAGENHLFMCDMAGPYTRSILYDPGNAGPQPPIAVFNQCICSAPVQVNSGGWFSYCDGEMGSAANVAVANAFTGTFHFDRNNAVSGGFNLTIGSGAHFSARRNNYGSGALILTAGATALADAGTAAGALATAGMIGELIQSNIAVGSAVALTAGATANLTSISLTPGDWEIWAIPIFTGTATTVNYFAGSLSLVSATMNAASPGFQEQNQLGGNPFGTGFGVSTLPIGPFPLQLGATTTIYVTVTVLFSAGGNTCSVYGSVWARRRR